MGAEDDLAPIMRNTTDRRSKLDEADRDGRRLAIHERPELALKTLKGGEARKFLRDSPPGGVCSLQNLGMNAADVREMRAVPPILGR
jgi:hypothetical protein